MKEVSANTQAFGRSINRKHRLSRVLTDRRFYYIAGVLGIILHMTFALPRYVWYQRLLTCVPLVVVLIVLYRCVKQGHKSVPMLLLVTVQIYIFYSLPQFTQEGMWLWGGFYFEPSQSAITTALVLVIFGELMFILGYQLAARLTSKFTPLLYRLTPTPKLDWAPVLVIYIGLGLTMYGWAALRPEYVPVVIRYTASTLFNIYLGLTIVLYLGFTFEKKRLVFLGYSVAVAMAVVGFIQGVLGAMLSPFIILFLSKWIWGRAFKVRSLVLIAVAAILINPVKDEFRVLAWGEKDVASIDRVQERLTDWGAAFHSVWVEGSTDRTPVTSTASRANDLLPFAQAIDYVPDIVPYNMGEGLTDAFLFWIPRVFWPTKKSVTDLIYNQYAVQFGFTDLEGTRSTSFAASVFTEGYWNFDKYGVIGFLLIYGLILGFLFGNNGKHESVSIMVCMVYIGPLIFILQALTIAVAGLFSFVVGVATALWGLKLCSQLFRSRHPNRILGL